MSKRCPHCGETDITKFGTDRSRKDGLSLLCSSCHNAYFRDYRRNHPKPKQHKPKACPTCGETDPAMFGRDARMSDGLALYCRTCSSAHNKSWYDAHKSIVSKRRKARRNNQ